MLRAALSALLLCWVLVAPALAEKRVALVIGNSAYVRVPALANPKNDAADMTKKLAGLGFEVVSGFDLTLAEMRAKVREFVDRIEGADLSLLFYAGHGLQVNGTNYIAPIDAELASYNHLELEAFPMELILSAMERTTKVNLVFLDACRDNPLAENLARSMGTRSASVGRGLAKLGSGIGSLIAFATQPGNVALDGDGRNSPFTTALLEHLGTPGRSVTDDLIHVRKAVIDTTQGRQVPWDNSSLTGPVALGPAEPAASVKEEKQEAGRDQFELMYWSTIKDSNGKGYFETYLKRYPEGRFVEIARLRIQDLDRTENAAREEADRLSAEKRTAEEEAKKLAAQLEADRASKAEAERLAADSQKAEEEARRRLAVLIEEQNKATEAARLAAEGDARNRAAELKAAVEAREAVEQKLQDLVRREGEQEKAIEPQPPVQELATLVEPQARTARDIEPTQDREVVRSIQRELSRVGCLSGRVDGKWGPGSQRALRDYAGRQGFKLASLAPDTETLDRLKATTARICPIVCGKGMQEKNGRCERAKRNVKVEPKPEKEAAYPIGSPPAVKNAQNQKRLCFLCPQGEEIKPIRTCVNDIVDLGTVAKYCKKI